MAANYAAPGSVARCTVRARVIPRDAIVLDDERYCCLGCVAGSACVCAEARFDDTPIDAPAPRREPAPRPGPVRATTLVTLEMGPLVSQSGLMHLAALLEGRPGIESVRSSRRSRAGRASRCGPALSSAWRRASRPSRATRRTWPS